MTNWIYLFVVDLELWNLISSLGCLTAISIIFHWLIMFSVIGILTVMNLVYHGFDSSSGILLYVIKHKSTMERILNTNRFGLSWSPVLGWTCWKTPGRFPAPYAEVALETTPSNVPGASCGYTNGVASSRVASSRTRSTPAPGAWATPAPSTAVPPH